MENAETLEQRVDALEHQIGSLRELLAAFFSRKIPAVPVEQPTGEATGVPVRVDVATSAACAEAPGIDKLRELLAAHGIKPGNEIVGQEIARMRQQEEDPVSDSFKQLALRAF